MRFILITVLCCSFTLLIAQSDDSTATKPIQFSAVEFVPVAEGCASLKTNVELQQCFQEKLLNHVAKNFKYPENARQYGVGARIFVNFVVEKDGSISNVEVVKGAKDEYKKSKSKIKAAAKDLDKAAMAAVSTFKVSRAAIMDDKPVRMSFTLPINAKLN